MSTEDLVKEARYEVEQHENGDVCIKPTGKIRAALDALEAELRGAQKAAERCLSLDMNPRPTDGGLQVGMKFVVAQSDWFRLMRLARWLARRDAASEETQR